MRCFTHKVKSKLENAGGSTVKESIFEIIVLVLQIIPKTIWNCIIAFFVLLVTKHVTDLVKKYQNEHIICYTFLFLIENNFWKMTSLSHNLLFIASEFIFALKHIFCLHEKPQQLFFRWLTFKFLLSRFSIFFLHPIFFPRFTWSRFFRVQIFLCSRFLGSRFFWVRVQDLGPGSRSRFSLLRSYYNILFW